MIDKQDEILLKLLCKEYIRLSKKLEKVKIQIEEKRLLLPKMYNSAINHQI